MRAFAIVLLCLAASLPCFAADDISGRWRGEAQVPGRPLALTVDLAKNASGAWIGSLIVPELNVKGVPLTNISAEPANVSFATKGSGDSNEGQIAFHGKIESGETISGDFSVGGNTAKFQLKKVGAASVDLPLTSTPLDNAFEGKWIGEYVFAGAPRHVTMTFANHAGAPASATFVIVGKKTTDVPVDLVRQDATIVIVQANAYQMNYEGKLHKDTGQITGTFTQGPYEVPLNLHREP
jgi:hypothetical protein